MKEITYDRISRYAYNGTLGWDLFTFNIDGEDVMISLGIGDRDHVRTWIDDDMNLWVLNVCLGLGYAGLNVIDPDGYMSYDGVVNNDYDVCEGQSVFMQREDNIESAFPKGLEEYDDEEIRDILSGYIFG